MEIYLPIVQVHIDIITILFISFAVGVLSGLFGVGGGFLMTPFLIFLGIPPVYAVPNEINNILATSVSGSMTHWFKNTLDYKMGLMIIIGGVVGTILGIITFTFFKESKENGDLYGTIKPKEIANLVKQNSKAEINPSQIILKEEINKIGVFKVEINFHSEVKANISLKVDKVQSK